MTWGSHCPRCGCTHCRWERDDTCDGEQRGFVHPLNYQPKKAPWWRILLQPWKWI